MEKASLFRQVIFGLLLNSLFVSLAFAEARLENISHELARIDQIPIFQLEPYPQSEVESLSRWTKQSLTAGYDLSGSLLPAELIKKYLQLSINKTKHGREASIKYFTPEEYDSLLKNASTIFKAGTGPKVTAQEFVKRYNNTVDVIVNSFMEHVLKGEGVDQAEIRNRWKLKIMRPFERCMSSATHEAQASACQDALLASLDSNVGLAILYSKLSSAVKIPDAVKSLDQTINADKAYRDCIGVERWSGDIDIKKCVLQGVRPGVQAYAHASATQKLESEYGLSASTAERVWEKSQIWSKGSFHSCLEGKDDEPGFSTCGDLLTVEVSQNTTRELISQNPSVIDAFPDVIDREKMIAPKVAAFRACADHALKLNHRKSDGALDVSECKEPTYNQVTRDVIPRNFADVVVKRLGDRPETVRVRERILKSAVGELNSCLPDSASETARNACVRKAVAEFSTLIADERMKKEIPAVDPKFFSTYKELPKMRDAFSKDFQKCLLESKGLPEDVTNVDARNTAIDHCEYQLRRAIYSKVAPIMVQQSRRADITGSKEIQSGVQQKDADYSKCLALVPDTSTYETSFKFCVSKYIGSVAKVIALNQLLSGLKSAPGGRSHLEKDEIGAKMLQYRFEDCVFSAKQHDLTDFTALVDDIGKCGDRLKADGTRLVKSWIVHDLSASSKNLNPDTQETIALVVDALPCMAERLSDKAAPGQKQDEAMLKQMFDVVAKTIDYNPANARQSMGKTIKEFFSDLNTGTGGVQKENEKLFELLKKNGVFDQLILSMIFSGISEKMGEAEFGALLLKQIVTRENVNQIFGGKNREVLDGAIENIIKPAFLEGKSLDSPALKLETARVEKAVAHRLVDSPTFGTMLIQDQVQSKIDDERKNLNKVARFIAEIYATFKGDSAFNWEKVRGTPEGQVAEAYIRDTIVRPKALGTLSPSQFEEATRKAAGLVRKAMF